MLPPSNAAFQITTANGRNYAAAPGTVADVPDFDAQVLAANGWVKVGWSGPTTARPPANQVTAAPYFAVPGCHFVDTTLAAVIVFDGATWRNPVTGAAV
jgi:hypothetical protein